MSRPVPDSITIAAICSPNPGLEYKGVDTRSQAAIFRQSFEAGDADTGNFLAIVHALRLLKRNKLEVEAIYSDSKEAISWVKDKRCKEFPRNGRKRVKLVAAVKEAEHWLRENTYKTKILDWNSSEWGDIESVVGFHSSETSIK